MPVHRLELSHYASANEVDYEVLETLGRKIEDTYHQVGDEEFPPEGGTITLGRTYDDESGERVPVYTLKFKVSKTAVTWWNRLDPDLTSWDGVAKKFTLSGKKITAELVETVKKLLEEQA